ncbi:MAG TPA: serine hydrolase domain-containing protein [Candidatus Binataceae bacterium]|nr:serine hydrolase domain-containing protein [Candidatus Binataceae bacterium]
MSTENSPAEDPRELGLDREKVEALLERAGQEVREGLLSSAQVAIARHGRIAAMRTWGSAVQGGVEAPATNATLYPVFSCTKAIVAAAAWILIGERRLDPAERVAEIIEEFRINGKQAVTVEQLLMHTCGFPNAPMPPLEWPNRRKRLDRFASWRLEWPPGSRFVYHPTASFWVLAEIIERRSGSDFRAFIHDRIAVPAGLEDLTIGLDRSKHSRVADLVLVHEPPAAPELKRIGLPDSNQSAADAERALLGINQPAVREIGIPGGGGLMTAGALALFYQSLLGHLDGSRDLGIWRRDTLEAVLRPCSGELIEPMLGIRVNRALGVVLAGDDGRGTYRGFGAGNSAAAFGHGGAGGQIGWADPASGLSFAYCTNGMDRNFIRHGLRGVALSTLAADCVSQTGKFN